MVAIRLKLELKYLLSILKRRTLSRQSNIISVKYCLTRMSRVIFLRKSQKALIFLLVSTLHRLSFCDREHLLVIGT